MLRFCDAVMQSCLAAGCPAASFHLRFMSVAKSVLQAAEQPAAMQLHMWEQTTYASNVLEYSNILIYIYVYILTYIYI